MNILLSPWIIVVEFSVLAACIFLAGRRTCNDYLRGLFLMTVLLDGVYLWVGLFNPDIQDVREAVRTVLLLDGGGGLYLILRYLHQIKAAYGR